MVFQPNPIDLITDATIRRSVRAFRNVDVRPSPELCVTGTVYHREHWQDHSSMLSLTEHLAPRTCSCFSFLSFVGRGCIAYGYLCYELSMSWKFIFQRKSSFEQLASHIEKAIGGLLPVGQEEVG